MISIKNLGLIGYEEALEYQTDLFSALKALKKEGKPIETEHLLLVEHPPVYTLGKHADENNILFNRELLARENIGVYNISRGGDVTFHGPGQLVAYPIIDLSLHRLGVKDYVSLLEQSVINTIAKYGISGKRDEGATGVWIIDEKGPRKICAIGVSVSRSITMHGLALNVNTDLSYFNRINPCGFTDRGVTSIAKELGRTVDFEEVKKTFATEFISLLTSDSLS